MGRVVSPSPKPSSDNAAPSTSTRTMLRLRYFPSLWKQADVVMSLKPGQSANWPQNYRPISLFPVKVLRIVEQIKEGFNLREYTRVVFLDVAKAFDKVWHQGLLLKMHPVISPPEGIQGEAGKGAVHS
ncbi:hypothetical protein Trydic_g23136 [Trypoxylus dichotomus]